MKTAQTQFEEQPSQPAAPFPTPSPLTEEIIIPNVSSFESQASLKDAELYQHDNAYPLTHKMIFDLFTLQSKVLATHDVAAFELAQQVESHVVEHVWREIRRGYIAETPLQLSQEIAEDAFTLHVARQYVISEIAHMRAFGPDSTIIPPEYVEQTLFDSIDEVELAIEHQPSASQPLHIVEIPVEQLSPQEVNEAHRFNDIVRRLGGKVANVLGVSFHSGEIPITKVLPVVDKQSEVSR